MPWESGSTRAAMAPATINASNGVPTGTEAVSNVQSLSRSIVNDAGQLIASELSVDQSTGALGDALQSDGEDKRGRTSIS